jgi:hypothetical protein
MSIEKNQLITLSAFRSIPGMLTMNERAFRNVHLLRRNVIPCFAALLGCVKSFKEKN